MRKLWWIRCVAGAPLDVRFVTVNKAAKPRQAWSKTRTPKRLEALQERMGSAIQLNLIDGIQAFKRKINPEAIYHAWITRDYDKLMSAMPWDTFGENAAPFGQAIGEGMVGSGLFSLTALPPNIRPEMRMDISNPNLQDYIANRSGDLVVNVKEDTLATIKDMTSRRFSNRLSPRVIADQVKETVGLYPRLANAVFNYQEQLLDQGYSLDHVQDLVTDYYNRLLDYRATTIARTETQRASHRAQLFVWKDAASRGLIDRAVAKKVWVVDGSPCEICAPMEGVAVGLDEEWELEDGESVEVPADSHPNCLCNMSLETGDSSVEGESTEEQDRGSDDQEADEEQSAEDAE